MNQMRVMSREGDIVITWVTTDGPSTERAKKEWDTLKAAGFEFFTPTEGNRPGKRVKNWDPNRGEVIAVPGVAKPAPKQAAKAKPQPRSKAMAGGPTAAVPNGEILP